jgi:predicted hydrolase (HD superfamily)
MTAFEAILKDMPQAEQQEEVTKLFRRVFGTEEGKIALAYLLMDLYYFSATDDPEAIARRNYASSLLRDRLGIKDPTAIVAALFQIRT